LLQTQRKLFEIRRRKIVAIDGLPHHHMPRRQRRPGP
jgi:hypothetical protein